MNLIKFYSESAKEIQIYDADLEPFYKDKGESVSPDQALIILFDECIGSGWGADISGYSLIGPSVYGRYGIE
jgi:hypothetical protein